MESPFRFEQYLLRGENAKLLPPHYGHPKEKRSDCKQVVFAAVVNTGEQLSLHYCCPENRVTYEKLSDEIKTV